MKFGQALSVFEAALPEEIAGPYRAALTKLQEAAPPLPAATVHKVLAEQLGPRLAATVHRVRRHRRPPRRASARCTGACAGARTGRDGRGEGPVPGRRRRPARPTSTSSARLAGLFKVIQPGLDVKPLVAELRDADHRGARLRAGGDGADAPSPPRTPTTPRSSCRDVVASVGAGSWSPSGSTGTPLSTVISVGTQDERDAAGLRLATLHFSAPARAGLLHADPHPGNFRILPDGRLGVLDFGAVARLPDGPPRAGRPADRLALAGRRRGRCSPACATRASSSPTSRSTPRRCWTICARCWSRSPRTSSSSPGPGCGARRPGWPTRAARRTSSGRQLNLPPSYLLIHRVTLGSIGVLCQLEAKAPYREVVVRVAARLRGNPIAAS